MGKWFGIILAGVGGMIIGISWYAGVFDSVTLSCEEVSPKHLIYREHRGSYRGIKFIMNNVYKYVRDSLSLSTDVGFAVFYDNAAKTSEDNLRSLGGIVTNNDSVRAQLPYKTATTLKTNAIVGTYRLRSFFSYLTGSYKFYSKRDKFIIKNELKLKGPVLELYDMTNRQIIFIAPYGNGEPPFPVFSEK